MKERNNEYIIYKAQNIKNGYVYIGTTSKSIEERKKDHINKSKNGNGYEFQEAISTYGADAFTWEQIDTVSSVDELAQLEQKYISEFNSKEEGYNNSIGGDFKKTVYQYDLVDGSLVNSYKCLSDAGNVINATKQSVSSACLSVNNAYKGFYWSYNYKEPFEPNGDKRRKKVCQMTLKGEVIGTYISVAEAARQIGINKNGIAKVCRGDGQQSGGFKWKYAN